MSYEPYYQPTQAERAAERAAYLARLNREHGVVEDPAGFKGWHLFWSKPYKPGVIWGEISRWNVVISQYEMKRFYCKTDILRVARELGYIKASNGLSLA